MLCQHCRLRRIGFGSLVEGVFLIEALENWICYLCDSMALGMGSQSEEHIIEDH